MPGAWNSYAWNGPSVAFSSAPPMSYAWNGPGGLATPSTGVLQASLLASIVTYLKATPTITGSLSTPDAITTDLANWGARLPYLLVEGYTEVLPGESTEDEPVDLKVCVYAGTIDSAKAIGVLVAQALDSPNINPNSIRTQKFAWTGGTEQGVMRDNLRVSREPLLVKNGVIAYEASLDYQFWITPNQ